MSISITLEPRILPLSRLKLCHKHGLSPAALYELKAKCGSIEISNACRSNKLAKSLVMNEGPPRADHEQ